MMEIAIKDLGEIITGNTPSKKEESFWNSEDICFVKPDGIANGSITLIKDSNEYLSENARKKARVVSKDAVFVTCIGSIGKIGIASEGDYAFNQQINVVIPNEKVLPKYLAYNLLFSKERLEAIANAPVVPIINKTQFGEFTISIEESIEKQGQIIRILDELSGIINSRKEELDKLDSLIKARFVEMFGDPNDRRKSERRHKIGELCDVTKLAGFEFTEHFNYQDFGEIIMLRGLNCKQGKLVLDNVKYIDRETSHKLPRSRLYVGDILMTYAGTIGDVAMVDEDDKYHLAPNVAKVSINEKDKVNPTFLVHRGMDSHEYIMTFASQVAQASINMQKIRDFEYVIPSMEEQLEFEEFAKQVDKSKVVA